VPPAPATTTFCTETPIFFFLTDAWRSHADDRTALCCSWAPLHEKVFGPSADFGSKVGLGPVFFSCGDFLSKPAKRFPGLVVLWKWQDTFNVLAMRNSFSSGAGRFLGDVYLQPMCACVCVCALFHRCKCCDVGERERERDNKVETFGGGLRERGVFLLVEPSQVECHPGGR